MIKFLIDNSANPNSQDDDGDIPLFLSIQLNLIDNVKCFVLSGVNLSITNKKGITPLIYACKCNVTEITLYLLQYTKDGVKVGAYDFQKNTALHFSAQHNNSTLIKALLDNGADPLFRNSIGKSPFSFATTDSIGIFKESLEQIRQVRYATSRSHSKIMHPRGSSEELSRIDEETELIGNNEDNNNFENEEDFVEEEKIETPYTPRKLEIAKSESNVSTKNIKKLPKQTQLEFEALKKSVDEEITEIRKEFNFQIDELINVIKSLRTQLALNRKNEEQ